MLKLDGPATAAGFAVAWPAGVNRRWQYVSQLLGGPAVPAMMPDGRPLDLAFLDGLVMRLVAEGLADPARVFLTGFSVGGLTAVTAGCASPRRFAALAVVSAGRSEAQAAACAEGPPLPILFISGDGDPTFPWAGFSNARGRMLSRPESQAVFARRNGCGAIGAEDGFDARDAAACHEGVAVRLARVAGAGHLPAAGPGPCSPASFHAFVVRPPTPPHPRRARHVEGTGGSAFRPSPRRTPMSFQPARRGLLLGGAALAFAAPRRVFAQAAAPAAPDGPFTLPPLPYAPDKNEAAIDATTMQIHHDRHHAGYVTALNNALRGHEQLAAMPLDELLMNLGHVPDAIRTTVRNNAGGHANHSMFWEIMGGSGGEPGGTLKAVIDRDLGGFAKMKTDFNANGMRVFGSGWTMVTVNPGGGLALVTKPAQDTPLMEGQRVLMGNDVWEHAYYLRYQNRRADYLAAWWGVLDWDKIAARYAGVMDGTLRI